MKSGYKIKWTDHALSELKATYDYLEINWTERELRKLSNKIERTLKLVSNNPYLFAKTDSKNFRKVVILKFNTLYYWITDDDVVEILSFFSNRQNPNKNII